MAKQEFTPSYTKAMPRGKEKSPPIQGRSPGGGYGQQRSDNNPPRPMYKEHPNHPDYKPGRGSRGAYNPNDPNTHPKPKPTKPSLIDMWIHRKKVRNLGEAARRWFWG